MLNQKVLNLSKKRIFKEVVKSTNKTIISNQKVLFLAKKELVSTKKKHFWTSFNMTQIVPKILKNISE